VARTTTTTTPGVQTTGSRTILSPIGVNVRAQPSKAAKRLGGAAQGTVLTILGHTDSGGGWFEVKGATVTGWISADPTLSAPGVFRIFSSGEFSALYPATWSTAGYPPLHVHFQPGSGPDLIVVAVAPAVTRLPSVPPGYGQSSSTQIVVCGVTSNLITYQHVASTSSTAAPYFALARLPVDASHALGFYANLSDVGPSLGVFKEVLASASFPAKQCTG
jgi:hypothetical protein